MARAPAAAAWRVVAKGLSPICSSMTSLPAAFSRRAAARTSKAASLTRPVAKGVNMMSPAVAASFQLALRKKARWKLAATKMSFLRRRPCQLDLAPVAGVVERPDADAAPSERLVHRGHHRLLHVVEVDLDGAVLDLAHDLDL